MADIVIRNGMIVDGARNPRYKGDVGIKDGKIARMGRIKAGEAPPTTLVCSASQGGRRRDAAEYPSHD